MRKSQKHDANLQKNSTLYFQIGLILCLLASYAILEMEFESKPIVYEPIAYNDDNEFIEYKNYVVEPKQQPVKQIETKAQKLVDQPPVVIDNDVDLVETPIEIVKPKVFDAPLNPNLVTEIEKPDKNAFDDNEIINLNDVEQVPIYPGCEKARTNNERLKCMSDKMRRLIQRKFNTSLGERLGLRGIQKIDVQFKIDKTGQITDIRTRAPFDLLEEEARRVVNKIPTMTPGMQRQKPVSVLYNLPIKFKVE